METRYYFADRKYLIERKAGQLDIGPVTDKNRFESRADHNFLLHTVYGVINMQDNSGLKWWCFFLLKESNLECSSRIIQIE